MSEPPAVEPDTKDWTWVLDRPCPECGFDPEAVRRTEIGDRTRATLPGYEAALARADATTRPSPGVWSPLEYGCHVRDVFRRFDERLRLMLTDDDPAFENWDQDATAVEDRYAEQDPAVVARELLAAGAVIARRFDTLRDAADDVWRRPGRRSNGSRFTVESLGRYFLHDVVHHVHDVRG